MPRVETNRDDAELIGFQALGWTLADDARAARLLALTGLDPGDLRARAGDPALLAAVIDFLAAHEPDLEGCAAAIDISPAALADAARLLRA